VPVSVPVQVPIVANVGTNTTTEGSASTESTTTESTTTESTSPNVSSTESSTTPPPARPPVVVTPSAPLPGLQAGVQATGPIILQQGGAFGGALLYTTGIPQAPATFVVDTSQSAMAMDGLEDSAPAPRPRAASPRRSASPIQRQSTPSASSGNVKVTIIKQGAP
jgi:hypothetical protein